MVLEVKVKNISLSTYERIAIIPRNVAERINVRAGDRIKVRTSSKGEIYIVEVDENNEFVDSFTIAIPEKYSIFKNGEKVRVRTAPHPKSKEVIKKKMQGFELNNEEIRMFVEDVYRNRLSRIEIASYLTSVQINGMSIKETIYLTKEMYKYGETLSWPWHWKIVDKHSIGGIAGNRTTPIIVSIVASTGLKIPKTSSRSITSPAGTADTVEVLADVEFSAEEIKRIVKKTNGCMVWGGALDLAPVDDKLIRVEKPLDLDPEGQVIASILSKKKSVGSKYVLIDIPYGDEAKITNFNKAKMLAKKFKIVGAHIGMVVESIITKGHEPIGNGVGPVLEMIDILNVLYGKGPKDLREKSLEMAGIILELTGKGSYDTAKEILDRGKAFKKFKEIIHEQNGSLARDLYDMLGTYTYEVTAEQDGIVERISNKAIAEIAKRAGAPSFKGAGVYLYKKLGDKVKKGDVIFKIYAESERKLDYALEVMNEQKPYLIAKKKTYILAEII